MDVFSHGIDISCPECPPYGKKGRRHQLDCVERNYSGCGVDIGQCPECGKAWTVSYKVEALTRVTEWDRPTREEQDAEAARITAEAAKAAVVLDRAEYERLKAKFGLEECNP